MIDAYFWLGEDGAFRVREPLEAIRDTARAAIEEFEKVRRIRKETADRVAEIERRTEEVLEEARRGSFEAIDVFVERLAALRGCRGAIISARELRYVDLALLDTLEERVREETDNLSRKCVAFLLSDGALDPYATRVEEAKKELEAVGKVTEADALEKRITETAAQLEMLIEIVGNLEIEDATEATRIIDDISAIYARLNQVKALLKNRRKDLSRVEGTAHFNAQVKLLNQSVANYLDLSDTPEKCDENLTKVMLQLEEMEGRFADFDEFIGTMVEKREEISSAFTSRKVRLVEERNRRAQALYAAAERVLNGIRSRASAFRTLEDLNAWYASDRMVAKVRDLVEQLQALGDSVKADDLLGRLKTLQQETVRQLRDARELYEDGEKIIRFGKYRFSVNTQPLDCTMVERDGEMYYHLTGIRYFEKVSDPEFLATRPVWKQEVLSENEEIYRAEYLAACALKALEEGEGGVAEFLEKTPEERLDWMRAFATPR
ncbi:MAG: hypothetical protein D6679_03885 [Candidatus Hydrogenedentota bacterium]|nr:MAG: hypothetical protein D6679_03885 [Candidatus Hydrogenedentota bacterium]